MASVQRQALDFIVRHWKRSELEKRAEFFTSLFDKYLDRESQILDIGGGWGFYHRPLVRRGHQPIVLEVVKPGYQQAPVVLYDGCRIPFPDMSFDASLLVTVMHHIPDYEGVLREAIRVTRKRILVVEDLYRHSWGRFWTLWRDRIYNFEYCGHPGNFKTQEGWNGIFKKLELRIEHFEAHYTWLAGLRILNGVYILNVPR
ncbi:MAG: class I SAM-dependent methyltransferase [Candidatus Omnitrophota bacterium]